MPTNCFPAALSFLMSTCVFTVNMSLDPDLYSGLTSPASFLRTSYPPGLSCFSTDDSCPMTAHCMSNILSLLAARAFSSVSFIFSILFLPFLNQQYILSMSKSVPLSNVISEGSMISSPCCLGMNPFILHLNMEYLSSVGIRYAMKLSSSLDSSPFFTSSSISFIVMSVPSGLVIFCSNSAVGHVTYASNTSPFL